MFHVMDFFALRRALDMAVRSFLRRRSMVTLCFFLASARVALIRLIPAEGRMESGVFKFSGTGEGVEIALGDLSTVIFSGDVRKLQATTIRGCLRLVIVRATWWLLVGVLLAGRLATCCRVIGKGLVAVVPGKWLLEELSKRQYWQ